MSERATPETDAAERLYADRQHHYAVRDLARKLERERDEAREELADHKASEESARDTITEAFLKVVKGRDEARELARELRDVLELYKIPYADADLVGLAESTTGMGEIGTTEAKREIIRRHLVTKSKKVLP